jgi:predicted ATP-dependent serine protease
MLDTTMLNDDQKYNELIKKSQSLLTNDEKVFIFEYGDILKRKKASEASKMSVAKRQAAEMGVSVEDVLMMKQQKKAPVAINKYDPDKVKFVQLKNVDYDPSIFIPLMSGTKVDFLFSTRGGIMPATNIILIGDPGAGKSTLGMVIAANIQQNNPDKRILFISSEMTEIDLCEYLERFPIIGELQIMFLMDYIENDPKKTIEEVLNQGWDFVFIDSFAETVDTIKSSTTMTSGGAESWFIDLFVKNNKGNNQLGLYTTFLAVQQVTKAGVFVGSNKLKHNTTAMLELKHDGNKKFLVFTKNRRGDINKRLYLELNQSEIFYDTERFRIEEEYRITMAKGKAEMKNDADAFDNLFKDQNEDNSQDNSDE